MTVENAPLVIAFSALLIIHASSDDSNEKCFEELGCFPLKDCPQRPLHPAPQAREKINTTFMFYTRERPGNDTKVPAVMIQPDDLKTVAFKANRTTVMIVHGWLDSTSFGKWLTQMKDALLRHGDYNVILVEWIGGNGPPYFQATVNTRVVGAEMGLLIVKLGEAFGIPPSSVHVFGHSLGGHIVGYAGKWLHGALGRITSLDPAKPLFQICPPQARLSNTDAQFVEVVHTDTSEFVPPNGLGMDIAVGDVDYFPNGGLSMPGCEAERRLSGLLGKDLLDITRTVTVCNHLRAIDFTLDHIQSSSRKSKCRPIAFPCESYERFERGLCTDCGPSGTDCAIMSLVGEEYCPPKHKTNVTRRLFLKTNAREPFCLFHFGIELGIGIAAIRARLLHTLTSSALHAASPALIVLPPGPVRILVNLKAGGSRGFDLLHHTDEEIRLGVTHRFLITSEVPLEDVISVTIIFQDPDIAQISNIPLKYLKFTPMTAPTTSNSTSPSKYFCPPSIGVPRRIGVDLKEENCNI